MSRRFLLLALTLLVLLALVAVLPYLRGLERSRPFERRVSLEFIEADQAVIAGFLASDCGFEMLDLVREETIDVPVNMMLTDVKLGNALEFIALNYDRRADCHGRRIMFRPLGTAPLEPFRPLQEVWTHGVWDTWLSGWR